MVSLLIVVMVAYIMGCVVLFVCLMGYVGRCIGAVCYMLVYMYEPYSLYRRFGVDV